MTDIKTNELLDRFPKTRPALPEVHQKIYDKEYKKTRGSGKDQPTVSKVTSRLNNWMHDQVAAPSRMGESILEIGAGTLNHLRFEEKFSQYDIVEPYKYLFEDNPDAKNIGTIYNDLRSIKGDTGKYDRIFSIAVLEHLTELSFAVAKSGQLLTEKGSFQAGIPSEGGLLWGIAWRMTTGPAYKFRNGVGKQALMDHEHVNKAKEIISVVSEFFEDVQIKRFPFNTNDLSVYTYIEAKEPKLEKCAEYESKYLKKYPNKPAEVVISAELSKEASFKEGKVENKTNLTKY